MTKQLLILISIALLVALLTSGTCSGSIDTIFPGWRDTTGCTVGGGWNCFGANSLTNDHIRDNGAMVLIFLVWFSVLLYGLFKVSRWIWRKLA